MPENRTAEKPTGWVPVPDPTTLTTDQLRREIGAVRELLDTKHETARGDINRLYEENAKLRAELSVIRDAGAKLVSDAVKTEERFKSIAIQFAERDTRTEQTSRDSKVAVDAALQAAKEAVGEQNKSSALAIAKSEASTTKQIDQQGTLIQTTTAGINDKIDDVKERLTALEGRTQGTEGRSKGIGDTLGTGLALVVGLAVVAAAVFAGLALRHP